VEKEPVQVATTPGALLLNEMTNYLLTYYEYRALKRTKAISSFNEVQPTVRNKPSGLLNDWPQVLAKTSPVMHQRPSPLTLSTPSSSLRSLPATPSPLSSSWQPYSSSTAQNVDTFDPSFSTSPFPFLGQHSFPPHLTMQNQQSANNTPQFIQAMSALNEV
jgi:hypothetical protein